MAQLPNYQSSDRNFQMMQSTWSAILNPVLASPMNNVSIIKGVNLISGVTTINHLLGKTLSGWFIVDINGGATVFRSQPKNDLTLTLTSSAAVVADIAVF